MNATADNTRNLRWQRRLSVLTILIGVALLIMMIVVEDEPGALPLLLIIVGTAWYLITRSRTRSRQKPPRVQQHASPQ